MNANTLKYLIMALFIGLAIAAVLLWAGIIPGVGGGSTSTGATIKKAELTVWGTQDEQGMFASLTKAFQGTNPGIKITYVKKASEGYEDELVRAFAAGKGPDIFGIHNTWLQKYSDLLGSAPQDVFSANEVRTTMTDVVQRDFLVNDSLYAIPLSLDTLALYYNTDLFNSAGIVFPPATWDEFVKDSRILTKRRQSGDFTVSGAALGGSTNVSYAPDILTLLMLQYGVPIVDATGSVRFAVTQSAGAGSASPAEAALDFYTSFARPSSPNYSWAKSSPLSSEDLFAQNQVGMMFGYAGTRADFLKKSPRLHFDIAPVPQVKDSVFNRNYASYWGFAVSKYADGNEGWAWDYVLNVTKDPARAMLYAGPAKRSPAVRRAIAELLDDPDMSVFARQALTAGSWYEIDADAARSILDDAIKNVLMGRLDSEKSLKQAEDQVSQLMRK